MRKAITITAPWAWAIAHAGKRVENRTWTTKYRGPLLIHAGVKNCAADRLDIEKICGRPVPSDIVSGAIIARARLIDVVMRRDVDEHLLPWAFGPYCWILEDVQPYARPIPAAGKLGLWNFT